MKNKKEYIFWFVMTIIFGAYGIGWSQSQVINAENIEVIDIELYRGIVNFSESKDDKIHLYHHVYDYDKYRDKGVLVDSKDPRGMAIKTMPSGRNLKVLNPQTRDLQYLSIDVPEHIYVKLKIKHFGEVKTDNIAQPIEVEIYQGSIYISNARNSVNAAIIRDGDIKMDVKTIQEIIVALSTFDGNIDVTVPPHTNASFLLNSQIGQIINNLRTELKKVREIQFKGSVQGREQLINSIWYEGKLNTGAGSNFMLNNVHGQIILNF